MPDNAPSNAGDTATTDPLAGAAATQAKRWSDATERIRARTDTSAKALAALGTTGITAAGLSKFADIFPLPSEPSKAQLLAIVGVLGGLVVMATAVVWLTARLWRVSQPIFMSPRLERMRQELNDPKKQKDSDEFKRVKDIYDEAAKLNDTSSLEVYAMNGLRRERIAQNISNNPPVASLAKADAALIRDDVTAAMARAATTLVRQRAYDAVRSKSTAFIFAMFLLGLLSFGVGADYLDSERTTRVAGAKACADAVTAIRTADPNGNPPVTAKLLPELCGGADAVPTPTAATPTAEAETSGAVKDLATRYETCVTSESDDTKCVSIKAALNAALK